MLFFFFSFGYVFFPLFFHTSCRRLLLLLCRHCVLQFSTLPRFHSLFFAWSVNKTWSEWWSVVWWSLSKHVCLVLLAHTYTSPFQFCYYCCCSFYSLFHLFVSFTRPSLLCLVSHTTYTFIKYSPSLPPFCAKNLIVHVIVYFSAMNKDAGQHFLPLKIFQFLIYLKYI